MNKFNFRYITVEDCSQCPFSKATRDYSSDSFATSYNYTCVKTHEVVAEHVEPFDKFPEIPNSCPLPRLH